MRYAFTRFAFAAIAAFFIAFAALSILEDAWPFTLLLKGDVAPKNLGSFPKQEMKDRQ